jgi:hypothetical protein
MGEEDFFSGGVAMRCRVPSTSATQEMVMKHKTAPGLKVILLLRTMAMESALIGNTPYMAHQLSVFFIRLHTWGYPHGAFG